MTILKNYYCTRFFPFFSYLAAIETQIEFPILCMVRFPICFTRISKVGKCIAFQLWTPTYFVLLNWILKCILFIFRYRYRGSYKSVRGSGTLTPNFAPRSLKVVECWTIHWRNQYVKRSWWFFENFMKINDKHNNLVHFINNSQNVAFGDYARPAGNSIYGHFRFTTSDDLRGHWGQQFRGH